jgi:hypothetical protein
MSLTLLQVGRNGQLSEHSAVGRAQTVELSQDKKTVQRNIGSGQNKTYHVCVGVLQFVSCRQDLTCVTKWITFSVWHSFVF